jgi:hypothetical protein
MCQQLGYVFLVYSNAERIECLEPNIYKASRWHIPRNIEESFWERMWLLPTPITAIAASASIFARQDCAALARIGEDFGFVGDATSVTVCVPADTCAEAVCSSVRAEEKDLGCGAHVENG